MAVGVRYGSVLRILLQLLFRFFIALRVMVFASASGLLGYVRAALVRFALLA